MSGNRVASRRRCRGLYRGDAGSAREKHYRSRPAGFVEATGIALTILRSRGAATFVLFGEQVGSSAAPLQITAYVASGVGFLGGGVILRQGVRARPQHRRHLVVFGGDRLPGRRRTRDPRTGRYGHRLGSARGVAPVRSPRRPSTGNKERIGRALHAAVWPAAAWGHSGNILHARQRRDQRGVERYAHDVRCAMQHMLQ
jgi:hypothetical protein